MNKRWIAVAAAATFLSCSPSTPSSSDGKEAAKAEAPRGGGAGRGSGAPAAGNIDKAKVGDLIKRYYTSSGQIPEDVDHDGHGDQALAGDRPVRGIAAPCRAVRSRRRCRS